MVIFVTAGRGTGFPRPLGLDLQFRYNVVGGAFLGGGSDEVEVDRAMDGIDFPAECRAALPGMKKAGFHFDSTTPSSVTYLSPKSGLTFDFDPREPYVNYLLWLRPNRRAAMSRFEIEVIFDLNIPEHHPLTSREALAAELHDVDTEIARIQLGVLLGDEEPWAQAKDRSRLFRRIYSETSHRYAIKFGADAQRAVDGVQQTWNIPEIAGELQRAAICEFRRRSDEPADDRV